MIKDVLIKKEINNDGTIVSWFKSHAHGNVYSVTKLPSVQATKTIWWLQHILDEFEYEDYLLTRINIKDF